MGFGMNPPILDQFSAILYWKAEEASAQSCIGEECSRPFPPLFLGIDLTDSSSFKTGHLQVIGAAFTVIEVF
jgi:hypothetical protein